MALIIRRTAGRSVSGAVPIAPQMPHISHAPQTLVEPGSRRLTRADGNRRTLKGTT